MNLPTISPNYQKAMFGLVALGALAGALTGMLYLMSIISPDQASTTAGTITGLLFGGIVGLFVIEKLDNVLC